MKDLILIIVSILWCIPILISFVISGLRKKLESDRNFYGKEISPKDIELVKVRYKPIDMKVSDFSECNKDGELQYFYKKGKSQDVVYAISKQEYDRYFLESTVAMTFVEGVVLFITILCTNNSTRVISQGNINTDQKVAWILKGIIISAVVTISLISMSPYTIGNYIDSKRDVWETDRNFYTNKIKLSDIKIKDNSSIGVECSFEKIKIQKNKNETFYYIIKNGSIFFISENDYKKFQEDHRKKVTMYEKRCVYSYKSDKGKIYAEMMDKQLSFTEKKFSNEELAVIKQAIWKNCHNKTFVNECDNGTSGYDRDDRTVYTTMHILIKNTYLLEKIDGRSLIKPGRYDRLYPDSEMYVREKNVKYGIKDKIMNYSAAVYYNKDGEKVHFVLDVIFYLIAAFYFGYSLMNDIDETIQNKRKEEKCKNG